MGVRTYLFIVQAAPASGCLLYALNVPLLILAGPGRLSTGCRFIIRVGRRDGEALTLKRCPKGKRLEELPNHRL